MPRSLACLALAACAETAPPAASEALDPGPLHPAPLPLGDVAPEEADAVPLPLGTVEWREGADCSGAVRPDRCEAAVVRCDGLPDLEVTVATSFAREPRGVVVVHPEGGGDAFFPRPAFVADLALGGLDVVQLRWASAWEDADGAGLLAAACRPSTLFASVLERADDPARATCAMGYSAGAGAFAYGLARYGLTDAFDYVALAAGPPFARIDRGCDWRATPDETLPLCPEIPDAPIGLPSEEIDRWEGTSTCGRIELAPEDVERWTADNLLAPAAVLDWPHTPAGFFQCEAVDNGSAAGAYWLSEALTSEHDVRCFTGCQGEDLGEAGWEAVRDELLARCAG